MKPLADADAVRIHLLSGVALAVLALLAVVAAGPITGARADTPRPCNGSSDLCRKTLGQTVVAATHNSMSASDLGWVGPNQKFDIPSQLQRGVRGFLIDTYYGRKRPNGTVENVPTDQSSAPGVATYLCHSICPWGASPLVPELAKVADFLKRNPREVLIFVNQDSITPNDFARSVEGSGLDRYLYRGPIESLPSLSRMIARNQRVVMLAEFDAGTVPWYHLAYEKALIETPYSFTSVSQLTAPPELATSCRANRGPAAGAMFLMNHWVSSAVGLPRPADAPVVNASDAIVARARACREVRGRLPNLVAVDFFGVGDVMGGVWELNGTTPGWHISGTAIRKLATRECPRIRSVSVGRQKAPCAAAKRRALLREKARWARWGS
ncbi:MAG: hypothetical protein ACO3CR_00250 [Solirubrobacterales bacterium]